MTTFIMLSLLLCTLFTILIYFTSRNPINVVMSYPKEIRDKVDHLPQYKQHIKKTKRNHIIKKIVAVIVFIIIMVIILKLINVEGFNNIAIYVFALFMVGNLYDLLIIDWIWVPLDKRWIINGTEEFVKELNNKMFHFIGFLKGTTIAVIVSLIVATVSTLIF